ncbi:DNA mismatch repair protein MutS [Polymorphobacter glacialis]|uniref:DNA mismatch repair protein MutS n=1 Tax=Sandarakinorhabdus glacialis TaxID=1614636 RepID=A0A916ZT73_9SPHN|nr:Smr/MutS family protein [Polymorphobacter glacialis]GGE13018.1 DNA mismatch repair protein MutS [Polymorphobacter glacialis]
MRRRLSAHEHALWSRVAATVRPLHPKAPAPETIPEPAAKIPAKTPPRPIPRAKPPAERPATVPKTPQIPVTTATLDGGWDRRLRQGDIRPDRVIDLHGHTLATAHELLEMALEIASSDGERIILIVTGKGRADRPGRIRAELSHWLETGNHRSRIAALRPAHPRHGGGGAFYLILRRRP